MTRISKWFSDPLNNVVFYALFGGIFVGLAYKNVVALVFTPDTPAVWLWVVISVMQAILAVVSFIQARKFFKIVRERHGNVSR